MIDPQLPEDFLAQNPTVVPILYIIDITVRYVKIGFFRADYLVKSLAVA